MIPRNLCFALLTALLLASDSHAAILQVTTSSPKLMSYAEWTDDSFGSTSDNVEITVINGSSANSIVNDFYFGSGAASGEASGSITIGDSSTLTFAIDSLSYVQGNGQYGEALLEIPTWTIEIVAESGETNGTPVYLNWTGAASGTSTDGGDPVFEVEIDSELIIHGFDFEDTFNYSDSGQITTYSIGDTFTLYLAVLASGSSDGSITYDSGTFLTVTAEVVPEPCTVGLLLTAAGAFFLGRRWRKGARQ